jgi:hypothetical protein
LRTRHHATRLSSINCKHENGAAPRWESELPQDRQGAAARHSGSCAPQCSSKGDLDRLLAKLAGEAALRPAEKTAFADLAQPQQMVRGAANIAPIC